MMNIKTEFFKTEVNIGFSHKTGGCFPLMPFSNDLSTFVSGEEFNHVPEECEGRVSVWDWEVE